MSVGVTEGDVVQILRAAATGHDKNGNFAAAKACRRRARRIENRDGWTFPKRTWPGDEPAPEPHPAPEVPCRPAEPDEVFRAAKAVAALAQEHGWTVLPTYARGTRAGRQPKVVDTLALRMLHRPTGRRAVAHWTDGKERESYVWTESEPGFPRSVTAAELKEWLSRTPPERQDDEEAIARYTAQARADEWQ